jgi:hypothetical protein
MSAASNLLTWGAEKRLLDAVVDRLRARRLSIDEEAALRDSHWAMGQDVRLRDDVRFRSTPWQRWMLADRYLANQAVYERLLRERRSALDIESTLRSLDEVVGRRCVLCPADRRLVLEDEEVRLSARELTSLPLLEETVGEIEKYVTHLPVHSLKAAAASEPAGQWGRRAQEGVIETLGWVRVVMPGRKLNQRMFVAQIEGHSMDDGRSGLVDGGYAVFELWPAGSKQNLDVLVRGAFTDPEMGSYAVKRYVADSRDDEGKHQRVTLVSLNPDKQRFPDIELKPENDDITIVAEVVHALSPQEFARRPKPLQRRGRRDIASPDGRQAIAMRLEEHVERFFAGAPAATSTAGDRPQVATWRAELVCLDGPSGSLHLEAGPLHGLWSFVKRLSVQGNGWTSTVLASNVRQRATRIQAPPSSGPWEWVAADFEDDPDVDLSTLALPGLASNRAHVFRVDAEGVGRYSQTSTLSPGQRYRILVPASLTSASDSQQMEPAGAGWSMWEIELPRVPAAQTLELTYHLGLEIGEPEPRMDWVLTPPVAWRTNARSEPYACFSLGTAPVVEVRESQVEVDGEAAMFLHGPSGTTSISLPAGEQHLLQLQQLQVGRYLLMLAHNRTALASPKLPFEIFSSIPAAQPATVRLSIGPEAFVARPGESIVSTPRDLSAPEVSARLEGLLVAAPPGWTVRGIWSELIEEVLVRQTADENGHIDTAAFVHVLRERYKRRPIGDVIFDFTELGRIVLRHERRVEPATLCARLAELVSSRADLLERLAGAFVDLMPVWFEPIVAALGFDVQQLPDGYPPEPPGHIMAYRLLHVERRDSRIQRKVVRILVLVERLSPSLSQELLSWIDETCATEDVREALLSDGLRWAPYRRGSRLDLLVWDLSSAVNDNEIFLSFLRVVSEGI